MGREPGEAGRDTNIWYKPDSKGRRDEIKAWRKHPRLSCSSRELQPGSQGAWAPGIDQRSPVSARNRPTIDSRLCGTAAVGHGKHGVCENAMTDFRAGNLKSSVNHILAGGTLRHTRRAPRGGGGLVTKWCLTLVTPMDSSLPGPSVHGSQRGKHN